jgi:hypothetical protein
MKFEFIDGKIQLNVFEHGNEVHWKYFPKQNQENISPWLQQVATESISSN